MPCSSPFVLRPKPPSVVDERPSDPELVAHQRVFLDKLSDRQLEALRLREVERLEIDGAVVR